MVVFSWAVLAILGTLLLWGFLSAILYASSRLLSGTGTLEGTLQVVGYGFLPLALSRLIAMPGLIFGYHPMGLLDISLMNPGMPSGTATAFFFAISVLMVIWTGFLWARGTVHAHHLPPWKGALLGVTMILVYYILTLAPLLLFFSMLG